ncbi:response regulator [Consotaella salsifontis]|uniref:response regulator n=1 Tax=Consotaella salsifontis TaxID=1365950 RepID=UPI0013F63451|nr:response regulator [Consotaella salsifontis]
MDDDPDVGDSFAAILEAEGATVATVDSARRARTLVSDRHRGCLLVDVHLGSESGFSLVAFLRERGIAMPVIFMTGSVLTAEIQAAARAASAVALVRKPMAGASIVDLILSCFEREELPPARVFPAR